MEAAMSCPGGIGVLRCSDPRTPPAAYPDPMPWRSRGGDRGRVATFGQPAPCLSASDKSQPSLQAAETRGRRWPILFCGVPFFARPVLFRWRARGRRGSERSDGSPTYTKPTAVAYRESRAQRAPCSPRPLGEGRGEGNGHGEQRLSWSGVALVAMAVSWRWLWVTGAALFLLPMACPVAGHGGHLSDARRRRPAPQEGAL
jgi:hypothetical protein